MADPFVKRARGVFQATIGSTAVTAGDPLYFDGTDWELADADDETKFAEAFSTATYASGVQGALCVECLIEDVDAPYTQGQSLYLSATAGDLTATRPTGANNLIQVLAFALSTSTLNARIKIPEELTINLSPMTDGTAAFSQRNDYTGVLLAAANEAAGYTFMVPQNYVGNIKAYLWWSGVGTALDTSDTYTVDTSGGVDDETNTAGTGGITAAALTVAADDLNRADVSAAFDATGILQPGNIVAVDVDKSNEGAGGDDALMLGCQVIILVV